MLRGPLQLVIVGVASACGPEAWEEPELVSEACATDEPILLSQHPGSATWFAQSGTEWSMLSYTTEATDTIVFDPCGGGDVHVFDDLRGRPLGDGHFFCAGGTLSWAAQRDAVPVPLVETELCSSAFGSELGVFVDTEDRTLLWFATPDAAPVVLAEDIVWAEDLIQGLSNTHLSLWVVDDRSAWVVTGDGLLERVDVRSGAREWIADGVASVKLTAQREAVVWSVREVDAPIGTSTVHVVADGSRYVLQGGATDVRWPGIVVASDAYQHADVLDIASGRVNALRVPSGYPLRADQGSDSILWLAWNAVAESSTSIFRIDFDGGYEYLAPIAVGAQVSIDRHGDGVLVTEIDVSGRPGYAPLEAGGLMRVSPTTGVEVLFDDAPLFEFALASDDRLLYSTWLFDEPMPGDLRVRNPDGSDRLFAADATLVFPFHYFDDPWDPVHHVAPPDLEGDVLVNLHDGGESRLWRMPFDGSR